MLRQLIVPGLLCVVLPSCSGLKPGGRESVEAANPYELTDNAGFSTGGFFGESEGASHGAAGAVYPADGQTFGAYDRAAHAGAQGAAMADHAQIAPFSESGYGPLTRAGAAAAASPKPAAGSGGTTAGGGAAPGKVASATKKPAASPATRRPHSRTTAGTKGGSVVKAVYHPSGSSGKATRKKATLQRVHTVKPGDTLSALASRYGVSVAAMKRRNALSSDLIRVGQRLAID